MLTFTKGSIFLLRNSRKRKGSWKHLWKWVLYDFQQLYIEVEVVGLLLWYGPGVKERKGKES